MERTLRIAADLLRASLVVGAFCYLAFSTWDKHMGYAMGLLAVAAIALRFAKAPAVFDFLFMLLLTADAWATAKGLIPNVNRDDRPGHLLISMAVTPLLYYGAARAKAVNAKPENFSQTLAVALVAAALTIALGALWEIVEWQSDLRLGTDMSLGYSDTLGDLLCDVFGGVAGGILVMIALTRERTAARVRSAAGPATAQVEDGQTSPALALDAIRE